MARPGNYNLTLYRGDTYRWRFQFWKDPDKTDPSDLTGVTPKAQIRDKPMGTRVIVEMQTALEGQNAIVMVLSADNCALVPKTAAWDLQFTYPGGDVATPLAGSVTCTPDVTDSTPPAGP